MLADILVSSEISRTLLVSRLYSSISASLFPGIDSGARHSLGLSMYCLTKKVIRMSSIWSFS